MNLYGDWWKPQVHIPPATEGDPLIEVMDYRESEEDAPCTAVRVYFERSALDILYTMRGCVEVWQFFNGETPDSFGDTAKNVHLCSVPWFIKALTRAEKVAAEHWRPI